MTIISAALLFLLMAGLAALPSSSVLLVVAQSASKGVKHGVATSMGVVSGDLIFMILAILGMTVLAEQLGTLFVIIKYVAAAYLIWFGIGLLRSGLSKQTALISRSSESQSNGVGLMSSYGAGLFLTLGDVKAIFFYASLLPGFIDLATLTITDIVTITLITIIAVGGVKILYAFGAERAVQATSKYGIQKQIKTAAGGLLTFAGVYLLFRD